MVLLLMRVWLVALMWRPTVRRSLVGLQAHAAHLCLHIVSTFMCTHNMLQSLQPSFALTTCCNPGLVKKG